MNRFDQSDVAYEDGPKEIRKVTLRKNTQFPGDVMPQTNRTEKGGEYVERTYPANPKPRGHEEYR
jgi:hypothetical protein